MKLLYSITLPILLLGGILGVLETKKAILNDGSKVDYTIDENKLLNGAYSVSSTDNKVWLRGSYKDNKRVGNWYCFNSDGAVALRYNYDLKKVIAIDDKMAAKIKFVLNDKDQNVVEKATVPVPICSIDQYLSLFNEQIYSIIGREQKNRPKEIPVDIVANIDSKGSVSYKLAYSLNGYNYSTKLIIKEKMYELDWSPSTYDGKIISAEVT
ncbi:MAG: hypothetical protein EOO93_19490, partial [Pedobacter sp.]